MGTEIVNRLSELNVPSAEFPRRFVPATLDFSNWNTIEPLYKELVDRKIDSVKAVEQWLLDTSELSAAMAEEGSRRYINMTCATDNEKFEKAFLYFVENIEPKIKPYGHAINEKLLASPYLDELDKKRHEVLIRDTRNDVELFREENIPLEVEISKLSQQYQKIIGAMTVEFRGKEYTLPQMSLFLQDKDRAMREESWKLTTERRLQDAGKLDELFEKMLELRNQVAKNAGFEDFRSYQFRRYGRFDYSPDDCLQFHDAVEKHVVPLTRQMMDERRQSLQIKTVRPWDTGCDRIGREPLKPFESTDKLADSCHKIFNKVDAELGNNFQKMIDFGLLDLASRKGKAPGGYQSSLSEVRLPFIFMNAVGVNRDVFTLLHEGGHAFHQFAVRNEPLLPYRNAPMEFAEVASMSMELLGAPYLEVFYNTGEASRARYDSLESAILLLPWIAIIDAFQHWIYTHAGHTAAERSDQFAALMHRFSSGVDWSGYEEALRLRWQAQLHIFEYPFYYIEYGIAQLGALQVWQNSRRDKMEAIRAYKSALALGGSKPLPQLFEVAGARFDFSDRIIQPLMSEVAGEMEVQRLQENQ